ncbi:hypothetical protein CRENBAI_025296 [Crenichthys baileyi]|uniref:Uncharacterized protein n=1 Tax=Crenichthys baileyi TaxID=28760 RepID=A0AAV9SNP2_9TELE
MSDYKNIKEHNGRSNSNSKPWRWLEIVDAIYSNRPVSCGLEAGLDSTSSLLEDMMCNGKGRRGDMTELDQEEEVNCQQRERHHNLQEETALCLEEIRQATEFYQVFLGVMGKWYRP